MDVGAQRLERRDVDDADFVGQRRLEAFADEIVDRRQKRREGLAGAGRRGDERVLTGTDRLPAAALRGRRLSERSRNQRETRGWNPVIMVGRALRGFAGGGRSDHIGSVTARRAA